MPRRKARPALTRLELEVMQPLWAAGAPRTTREVLDALNASRRTPLAYTTVNTVLGILKGKGVVASRPGPGRAHAYRALVTQDRVGSGMVGDLVARLFGGRVRPLLQNLVESEDLSDEELRDLKRLIEARLDDRPRGLP